MSNQNKLPISATFLGTGTSQGIPVIACECEVCRSANPKDKRLRSSLLVKIGENNFVIDAGPDFRQQMLRANVKTLRAVLLTHEHVDHVFGLDDIRSFNWLQKLPLDIYAEKRVHEAVKRIFHYVFANHTYPGIPKMNLREIQNKAFGIEGIQFVPIRCYHHKLPVFGFRVGDLTYVTDTNSIPPEELKKVEGSRIFILNALRREKHISHFNLEEALEMIELIKPEKAYLTHLSHGFGRHDEIEKELPENVFLAFDGLKITLD
jgi:phosphoribosyl 1,2-cyclic phosphate phosphodiesterase